jgi:hypothetical protein
MNSALQFDVCRWRRDQRRMQGMGSKYQPRPRGEGGNGELRTVGRIKGEE